MEKINIKPLRTSKTEEYRIEKANELLQNEEVRKFMIEHNLSKDYLFDNLSLFIRKEEENEVCKNCKGYVSCPKLPKGYITEIDPYLDETSYTACKHRLIYETVVKGYVRRDFYDEWLNLDLIKDIEKNIYRRKLMNLLMGIIIGDSQKGIYVHSDKESGKSVVLAAFANTFILQTHKKVAFVNVSDLLQDLKNQFNSQNNEIESIINELQHVDLLILDDIGGETFSAWSINDVLYKIIDYRNRSGLLTCYSSSMSIEELQSEYMKKSTKSNRLISKIMAYSDIVELKGISNL